MKEQLITAPKEAFENLQGRLQALTEVLEIFQEGDFT